MKKSLFFAGMLVIASVLATSCKPKVEAPKANFDYEANGLDVTFTNLSKGDGTLTYAWEFGDGAQSTEAAPKHTYAEAGEYDVTLTVTNEGGSNKKTNKVSLTAPAPIKIDGSFDDWGKLGNGKYAEASVTSKSKFENIYNVKFCADADYLYFYVEFNGEGNGIAFGEKGRDYVVDPMDFYLNLDGDETTGSNSYLWENSAADVLIEGFWADKYESAGVYVFPADADQTAWAWTDAEISGSTTTCEAVDLGNNHLAIEGSVMLAMMPVKVVSIKAAVFGSNSGWSESGALPETTLNDDGTTTVHPLLEVPILK